MRNNLIYIDKYDIVTPLGNSIEDCFDAMQNGQTGIQTYEKSVHSDITLSASVFSDKVFDEFNDNSYSRLERLGILALKNALQNSSVSLEDTDTAFILSSTKGNVELLESNEGQELLLWHSAKQITQFLKSENEPFVISNACVSGVNAIVLAQRLLQMGRYKNAVVLGIDLISKFIISGFQSFKALSPELCKPFDKNRIGLNLGEGAGVIVLTTQNESPFIVSGGATSNDANHISGPSRTGEGLLQAIKKSSDNLQNTNYISAHGTATLYNDDMESKAISRAGLAHVPTNSLKGYLGHTLGAAGVIESAICLESMKRGVILPSLGCDELGTAENINIVKTLQKTDLQQVIKLTSGFGGTNAVVCFNKN